MRGWEEGLKFSTKGEYGVRAVFEIAKRYGKGPIPIREIAERQGIDSVPYLEQLLNKLVRGGIVESTRGPGGGYVLARHPDEVTVGEVIRVLEGPIAPMACLLPDDSSADCKRSAACATRLLWKRVGDRIEETLNETTFGDLWAEEEKLVRGKVRSKVTAG